MSNKYNKYKQEENKMKICDCNKNYGNKDLQGVHDIDCESRKGVKNES